MNDRLKTYLNEFAGALAMALLLTTGAIGAGMAVGLMAAAAWVTFKGCCL